MWVENNHHQQKTKDSSNDDRGKTAQTITLAFWQLDLACTLIRKGASSPQTFMTFESYGTLNPTGLNPVWKTLQPEKLEEKDYPWPGFCHWFFKLQSATMLGDIIKFVTKILQKQIYIYIKNCFSNVGISSFFLYFSTFLGNYHNLLKVPHEPFKHLK